MNGSFRRFNPLTSVLSPCTQGGEANRLSIAVSFRNFTSSIPDVDLTFAN